MVSRGAMNNALLGALLDDRLTALEGGPGRWQARIEDWTLYIFADEQHDRVRIMVPVAEIRPQDVELLVVALSANFDRALDARYAMKDGVLWATFLHRLSWITEAEVDDAIDQVLTLARNTGSTFTSTELVFGGGGLEDGMDEMD